MRQLFQHLADSEASQRFVGAAAAERFNYSEKQPPNQQMSALFWLDINNQFESAGYKNVQSRAEQPRFQGYAQTNLENVYDEHINCGSRHRLSPPSRKKRMLLPS